jgi:hypothetical protein
MLQMVAQGNLVDAAEPEFDDPELGAGEEDAAARVTADGDGKAGKKPKKSAGKSRSERAAPPAKASATKPRPKTPEKRASAGAKSA